MTGRTRKVTGVVMAAAALAVAGCEVETDAAGEATVDTAWEDTASQSQEMSSEMYTAQLEALAESGVEGTATFTIENDEVVVTVAATGLEPNTRVPQHIHLNATCEDAGGIALNLDDALSLPNDGEPRGDAYPQSDDQGNLQYEARRSVGELRTALAGTGAEAAPSDTEAAWDTGASGLDLTGYVVNLHGADMSAIACGPIETMDHGSAPSTP